MCYSSEISKQYTKILFEMRKFVLFLNFNCRINDSCLDGLRRTLSTISDDKSIRVWDVDSMRQLYDFASPNDVPTCVSCHPALEVSF